MQSTSPPLQHPLPGQIDPDQRLRRPHSTDPMVEYAPAQRPTLRRAKLPTKSPSLILVPSLEKEKACCPPAGSPTRMRIWMELTLWQQFGRCSGTILPSSKMLTRTTATWWRRLTRFKVRSAAAPSSANSSTRRRRKESVRGKRKRKGGRRKRYET